MKTGLIFFCTNRNSWISNWIRWIEKFADKEAVYSHTGFVLGQFLDETFIFEMTSPIARTSLLSKYLNKDTRLEIVEVQGIDWTHCMKVLRKHNEQIYGFKQLGGALIKKMFLLNKNPVTSGDYCAEVSGDVIKLARPEAHNWDGNSMDVHQFYKKVMKDVNGKTVFLSDFGESTLREIA